MSPVLSVSSSGVRRDVMIPNVLGGRAADCTKHLVATCGTVEEVLKQVRAGGGYEDGQSIAEQMRMQALGLAAARPAFCL